MDNEEYQHELNCGGEAMAQNDNDMYEELILLRKDKKRLDYLDNLSKGYSGKIILRNSMHGRGWRLHETSRDGAVSWVRDAIDNFIKSQEE